MHLMIDLETLSTSSNAVITQMGWALFDIAGFGVDSSASYYIDPEPQIREGREVSWSTISWWLKQSDTARKALTAHTNDLLLSPLDSASIIFDRFKNDWMNVEGIWANGSNFDIPILENFFRYAGADKGPWNYRSIRDVRTIVYLANLKKRVPPFENEIKHSAEHDCIAQAKWVQNCYKVLIGKGKD